MLLQVVSLLILATAGLDALTLSDVCSDGKTSSKIESIGIARSVLKSDSTKCSNGQLAAARELGEILDPAEPSEACSMDTVYKIEDFHMKYIDPKSPNISELPVALRDFFVGLAMKLHQHCLDKMVKELPKDQSFLEQDDLIVIDQQLKQDGLLKFALKKPRDYDDLALLTEIIDPEADIWRHARAIRGNIRGDVQQIYLSCNNTFAPIYERRVMPSLRLARLGYKYISKELKVKLGPAKNRPEIVQWYALTFLCDAMTFYQLRPDFGQPRVYLDQQETVFDIRQMKRHFGDKRILELPSDGEQKLDDSIFVRDTLGEELAKEVKKFKPTKDVLKAARDNFVSQLSRKAKGVIVKRLLKGKIFKENDQSMDKVNVNLIFGELESKHNPIKPDIPVSIILLHIVFLMIPILGWVAFLHSVLTLRMHFNKNKRDREQSGLFVNI